MQGSGFEIQILSRWKYLGLEVWRYGEGEAKVLVEELFSREFADVHAHALAPRLLKELALLDDKASERTVNSPVGSTRTHLVEGRGFRFQTFEFMLSFRGKCKGKGTQFWRNHDEVGTHQEAKKGRGYERGEPGGPWPRPILLLSEDT